MGKLLVSPFTIQGELHQVHLFNFSVSLEELSPLIPQPFKLVNHGSRGWISLVDVHLKNMRPAGLPSLVGLDYHHIAYRVLVDCPVQTESGDIEWQRGVYFLESFSDNPLICWVGNLISEYQFLNAKITEHQSTDHYRLSCQSHDSLHTILADCEYTSRNFPLNSDEVKALVAPLTQAFSVLDRKVTKVQIVRERWPLEPVHCKQFEVSFFKTAQFEACFRVRDTIDYTWHKASEVPVVWIS